MRINALKAGSRFRAPCGQKRSHDFEDFGVLKRFPNFRCALRATDSSFPDCGLQVLPSTFRFGRWAPPSFGAGIWSHREIVAGRSKVWIAG